MRYTRSVALLLTSFAAACGSSSSSTPTPTPPVTNTWRVADGAADLTVAQRADFLAGTLYENAHTTANGSGEIRGQLDKGGTAKFATLTSAQETATNTSTAFGAGVLTVDESTGAIRGFVITSGLVSPTAAHVHPGARGVAGSPIVALTGGPDLWIVPDNAPNLTAAQITQFQNGELYFNVHTAANPGGEIRGQIDKAGKVRIAALDGAQETPANASTAFGSAVFGVDETTGAIRGFLYTTGIASPTAAHIHPGARGASGAPIVPLSGGPNLWVVPDAAADLSAAQITSWQAGDLYVNAHSTAISAGEIRGQLDKPGDLRLAAMDGSQETPAVTTTAFGAGLLNVDDSGGSVRGFILTSGLVSPTVAHVHQAARGVSGGPIVSLAGP